MSKFSKIALFALVAGSLTIQYGMAMDSSGWSNWLHEKVKPISRVRFGLLCCHDAKAPDANKEYQQLAREAQTALGVPLYEQLPVKNFSSKFPSYIPVEMPFAMTGPEAIYINPESIGHLSYGDKRSLFFHEGAHVKNHDETLFERKIVELAIAAGLMVWTAVKKPKYLKPVAAAVGVVTLCREMMSGHFETRADREGAYASGCHVCVDEKARRSPYRWGNEWDKHTSLAQGYLSSQELDKIRDELKSQNRLCAVHMVQRQ